MEWITIVDWPGGTVADFARHTPSEATPTPCSLATSECSMATFAS